MKILMFLLIAAQAFAQNFVGVDEGLLQCAEDARTRSAMFWTGSDMPEWNKPCVITLKPVSPTQVAGGGSTTFNFINGEVVNFRMVLQGERSDLIDNVIPHEVDHAVRASIVRRPITRWVDEGCAQLVESSAGRARILRFGGDITAPIPMNHFDATEYPLDDIGRFYARGYSWCEYLNEKHGTEQLLKFQIDPRPPTQKFLAFYGTTAQEFAQNWRVWYQQKYERDIELVVFTAPYCTPCALLKQHVKEGRFPDNFKFTFVNFDPATRTFDNPELHAEFVQECSPPQKELRAPTIWKKGTGKYTVGYSEPGLVVRWIRDVMEFILAPITGGPPRIPTNPSVPLTTPGFPEPLPDYQELKDKYNALKSDLEAIKNGDLKKIPDLIEKAKEGKTIITQAKEDPWTALFTVLSGLVVAVIKGRFDD